MNQAATVLAIAANFTVNSSLRLREIKSISPIGEIKSQQGAFHPNFEPPLNNEY